jgi:type IV pilus assembly protein PilY1
MKSFHKPAGFAAVACVAALAGIMAGSAPAQQLDISQTPLASASNLSVLPNLLFLLDDSGSMMFDTLPDHTERVQGGAERRYWHRNFNCKPKNVRTTGAFAGSLPNHCDRVDPPFGAAQFNGMYYNPQFTYRPPVNFDGTSFLQQTNWTSVPCDPFSSKWKCRDWYRIEDSYYNSGAMDAEEVPGQVQRYSNPDVKHWYGTGDSFNVQGEWPEIVYCREGAKNLTECRRNGLSASSVDTGNPFRYTTARWGAGGGGYPEAEPVHEFSRSSGTTVIVTMAYPHGQASGTFKIIPRTDTGTSGSGFNITSGTVTATPLPATNPSDPLTRNQFKYDIAGRIGARVAIGSFDLIVVLKRTGSAVTVTAAWNHGLNVGDELTIVQTVCTVGTCGFSVTDPKKPVTVTAVSDDSFEYAPGTGAGEGEGYYRKVNLYAVPKLRRGNPFYYTIEAIERCQDAALTVCGPLASAPAGFKFPAPVRYCTSHFDAARLDTPTGDDATNTRPRCRKKYEEDTGYIHPRYGQFRRVDIASSAASFGGRPLRTDCPKRPNCSFGEEMTNFANWFAYYRTRMLMMKSAGGIAFGPIDSRYRVGFLTINPDTPVKKDRYLKIDAFTPAHRQAWYDTFYQQEPRGGTPLPQALARAGRHFAGVKDGINRGMDDDPVQYSCQQNFALLTTDGYWSGRQGIDENGAAVGNLDSDAGKTSRPLFDGGKPFNPDPSDPEYSSSGTLGDVALHYYQTDLRRQGSVGALGADVSQNNVPTGDQDPANWQHMVTFGLGMSEGLMDWRQDYESLDATGDFDNVRKGALGVCSWTQGGVCNWPMPGSRKPSNLDDLWHAAVNGRGKFFYAADTVATQAGLDTALTNLNERNAAGAAAATSTPNVTPTDRAIFRTVYRTVQWDGDVTAQFIDPNDGSVLPTVAWSARDRLQGRVGKDTDTRTIHLAAYDRPDGIKDFEYDQLNAIERAWFDGKCKPVSNMTQCALLEPATQLPLANSGENLVDFLRGQTQHEVPLFRDREFVLGDTVNAVPSYVARPRFAFADKVALPYLEWKEQAAVRNRTPMVYVGANDGQVHAFNVNSGDEVWSFIPRQVAPGMWKLAEAKYATKHQYYVDGSPVSMDVWDGGTWRTILVGGLNAGGRGFYALDITNPNAPRALWEFCNDETLCPVSDLDVGFSFGNPIITKRDADQRWVVLATSGYNNVDKGDGKGYLYVLDAIKGTLLEKIGTGAGSPGKPSGFARISGWADNFIVDNSAKWVFGGDQDGNIWKIDLTVIPAKVLRLAQALDPAGMPQPITTRPELGLVNGKDRVVYVGTGRYLGVRDLTDPATQKPVGQWAWQQSIYAFKDLDTPLDNLRNPASKLVQKTLIELAGGAARTVSSNTVNWSTQNGWYLDLNPNNQSPGERVNVDPQLALGTLIVASNVPGASACSVGGDSWIYQLDYRSGAYVQGAPSNLVARKQTGALTVGLVVYQLQKGSIVGQIQRSETLMRKEEIIVAPGATPSRRISWREITPGMR